MKRFTSTKKWDKTWYRKLPPKIKCLWQYICDKCDQAGMWEPDLELASFQIGEDVSVSDLDFFGDKLERLKNGKIWVVNYVEFQSGVLSYECPPHRPILKLLEKYGLLERVTGRVTPTLSHTLTVTLDPTLPATLPFRVGTTLEEKEKEKELEKEKEKDKETEKEKKGGAGEENKTVENSELAFSKVLNDPPPAPASAPPPEKPPSRVRQAVDQAMLESLDLSEEFSTDEFKELFRKWIKLRMAGKKPKTEWVDFFQGQLKEVMRWQYHVAIHSITAAVMNQWEGLHQKIPPRGAGVKVTPESNQLSEKIAVKKL